MRPHPCRHSAQVSYSNLRPRPTAGDASVTLSLTIAAIQTSPKRPVGIKTLPRLTHRRTNKMNLRGHNYNLHNALRSLTPDVRWFRLKKSSPNTACPAHQ